eukprot:scaffold34036_cov28-Tisochrysis_lutea.AAC.6
MRMFTRGTVADGGRGLKSRSCLSSISLSRCSNERSVLVDGWVHGYCAGRSPRDRNHGPLGPRCLSCARPSLNQGPGTCLVEWRMGRVGKALQDEHHELPSLSRPFWLSL